MILAFIQKWALKVLIAVALLAGVGLYSYNAGIQHQKGVDATKVIKVDNKITQKNDSLQATADKTASQVIVYKDRIVTKYKTINHDVVTYANQNPNGANLLDPEFVRLHNSAASAYDQDPIAGSSSGADGSTSQPAVTTGEAIATITANYKRYYQCQQQVGQWIDFYTDIRTKVNGPDPK